MQPRIREKSNHVILRVGKNDLNSDRKAKFIVEICDTLIKLKHSIKTKYLHGIILNHSGEY